MTHAFWYVQGSDEKQIIISGGPNNLNGTAYLNVGAIPTYVGDPELLAPVWWKSPLSCDICTAVDNMLKGANTWPQNKIPYFWKGPNSNGSANYFGSVGGFFPTAPPESTGWDSPIPISR